MRGREIEREERQTDRERENEGETNRQGVNEGGR